MITGQRYKQFIKQQAQLEKNIAEGFGYQINQKEYIPQKSKIYQNIKVTPMNPLKNISPLPISNKLVRVEQQLKMLQNQRKLAIMTQKAKLNRQNGQVQHEDQSAAIKMMKQCIEQYNFIVAHRHIIQKNSDQARKILGIKKSGTQILNQRLSFLKQKLKRSTFTDMIEINKQIAVLYKQYQRDLRHLNSTSVANATVRASSPNKTRDFISNRSSVINSSNFSPKFKNSNRQSQIAEKGLKKLQKSIELKDILIMPQLKQSEQGDSQLKDQVQIEEKQQILYQSLIKNAGIKLKRRTTYCAPRVRAYTQLDTKQKLKQQRKTTMNKTMNGNFLPQSLVEKGKNIDRLSQQNQDVIEVWRQRILQNNEKNNRYINYNVKNINKNLSIVSQMKQQTNTIETTHKNNIVLKQNLQIVKRQFSHKQKIIASLLARKQSKFKKLQGTKIMRKNDFEQSAKTLLRGKGQKVISQKKLRQSEVSLGYNNKTQGPQWDKIDQMKQELYWSMCKNQKLNIRLKNKR